MFERQLARYEITSCHSSINVEVFTDGKPLKLIGVRDGSVNELPSKDTTLVLTIGDFYK